MRKSEDKFQTNSNATTSIVRTYGPSFAFDKFIQVPLSVGEILISDLKVGRMQAWLIIVLLSFRQDSTSVWPSLQTLAKYTWTTRQNVSRELAKLEKKGWIKKSRTFQGNKPMNVYDLSPVLELLDRERSKHNEVGVGLNGTV